MSPQLRQLPDDDRADGSPTWPYEYSSSLPPSILSSPGYPTFLRPARMRANRLRGPLGKRVRGCEVAEPCVQEPADHDWLSFIVNMVFQFLRDSASTMFVCCDPQIGQLT